MSNPETIFCPNCGKALQSKRRAEAAGGENFEYECLCTSWHTLFVRRWGGQLASVYFIDPLKFEEIWKANQ